MKCPYCGAENAETAKVCTGCGEVLEGVVPKVTLSKEPAAASKPLRKFSPKSIVSMVLGLISVNVATGAAVYSGLAVALFEAVRVNLSRSSSSYYYYSGSAADFGAAAVIAIMCFAFAAIGIGTAIPALVLSPKGMREGTAPGNHGIAKCGKVTGIIGLILCGISVAVALIALFSVPFH